MTTSDTLGIKYPHLIREAAASSTKSRKEIVFIDASVNDISGLLAGISQDVEVRILDQHQDGVAQLALWASDNADYDAIHLLSHGQDGELQLGSSRLNNSTLGEYSEQLSLLGNALKEDGDLLLYGCNLAADTTGVEFVGKLAAQTGADIAASDDTSGSLALGGDWQLEYATGEVTPSSALDTAQLSQTYEHALAITDTTVHTYSANTWAFAQLATDSNGVEYLVHKVSGTEISVKTWDGSSWSTHSTITTTDTGNTYFSDDLGIAIDSNDNIHLVYRPSDGSGVDNTRGVGYAEYDGNQWTYGWVENASDSGGGKNFDDPAITVDSSGNAHLLYNYSDSTGDYIRYATNASGSWVVEDIASGAGGQDEVFAKSLAIASNGDVYAFYEHEDNQNSYGANLYYEVKSGGTWSSATKIVDNTGDQQYYYTSNAILDSNDKIHVFYADEIYDVNDNFVSSTVRYKTNSSGSWSTSDFSTSTTRSDWVPLIQEQAGDIFALFDSYTSDYSSNYQKFYVLKNGDSSWTEGNQFNLPIDGGTLYDFSVDASQNITLVQEDSGLRNIYSQTGAYNDYFPAGNPTATITIDGTPAQNASSVTFNIEFSASVTNVSLDDFTLTKTGTADGSLSTLSGSGTSYTISATGLSGEGTLRLDLNANTNIQDGSGNIAEAYNSGTAHTLDLVGPVFQAASSSPADDSFFGSDLSADISLSFSENILLDTGSILLKDLTTGQTVETFSSQTGTGDNGGSISASGATLTLNPGANLLAGTEYAINIASGAITDSLGNSFSGFGDDTTYNFSTLPLVELSADQTSITELGDEAVYTLVLKDALGNTVTASQDVQINLAISGSATGGGTDYNLSGDISGNTVTITSGSSSASFTLTSIDDAPLDDDAENVIINIDTVTNGHESGTQTHTLTIEQNERPTLTSLSTLTGATEDTSFEVTMAQLLTAGDEADSDGSVEAFTVTAVTSGTLKIGADEASATAWDGTTNAVIDATHNAYWTPAANSNGELNAFSVVATDNQGTDSLSPVQLVVDVSAVNDDPSIVSLPTDITVIEDTSSDLNLSAVTFSDIDAQGSNISLTLNVDAGSLSAGDAGNVTVSGSGTSELSLTGTAADIDAYLNTSTNITYLSALNASGNNAALLTLSANDGGNTGSGGGTDVPLGTVNLDITAVNDAPTGTGNAALPNTDENTNSTIVTIDDLIANYLTDAADVDGNTLGIAITDITGNGTWKYWHWDGAHNYIDIGTVSETNALILAGDAASGLYFDPDNENGETPSLTFRLWDGSAYSASTAVASFGDTSTNGGSSAFSSSTHTASLVVTDVNDSPVINLDSDDSSGAGGTSFTTLFVAEGPAVAVADTDAVITDVDLGDQIESLTATILNRPDGDLAEALSLNAAALQAASDAGLSVSYTSSSGLLSITGTANSTVYEAILHGVQYQNTSSPADIDPAGRLISFAVSDGDSTGSALTQLSVVTAPVIDLGGDGNETGLTTGYLEGSGQTALATQATVTEASGDNISSLTITLDNPLDGIAEGIQLSGYTNGELVGAVTIDYVSSSSIVLSGTASSSDYQSLVRALVYSNTLDAPNTSDRTITVQATDENGHTGTSSVLTVEVTDVNDAPTLTIDSTNPGFVEDAGPVSVFSNADVSTIESGQSIQGLSLSATNVLDTTEQLIVDNTSIDLIDGTTGTTTNLGLSYSVSLSGGTADITFTSGTMSVVETETLLNGIAYANTSSAPTTSSDRVITLTQLIDNGGQANAGSDSLTLNQTSTVSLQAVNDAPGIEANSGASVYVSRETTITNAILRASDPDDAPAGLTYTLDSIPDTGILLLDNVQLGVNDTFTQQDIDDGKLVLRSSSTTGQSSFNFTLADGGEDGALSVSDTFAITVSTLPPPPAPEPEPEIPPADEWDELSDVDDDGIPEDVESFVPSLGSDTLGDGNGDGLADESQQDVASVPFLATPTPSNDPDANQIFVSLVGGSQSGKVTPGNSTTLRDVQQVDKPENAPDNLNMPLGMISFNALVDQPGKTESFSLYVDGTVPVSGYWKQDRSGEWVNLVAEEGGAIALEGGKIRFDFQLTDGGEFDADGEVNGVISDPGALSFSSDWQTDLIQTLYIAYYQRPADVDGLAYWKGMLADNDGDLGAMLDNFASSSESQRLYGPIDDDNVGYFINSVYKGLFNRMADSEGVDFYREAFLAGQYEDGRPATAANLMFDILNGAQGQDFSAVTNKTDMAHLFTWLLDPGNDGETLASYDVDDEQLVRDWLSQVTSNEDSRMTIAEVFELLADTIADSGDAIKLAGEGGVADLIF
ncbi:DUF4347 domain-containing protein [Marinobacterium stanieri]|uniref:Cadherin-like n=1 Tax=Marinobacterium stanieri TaxID=49186 RepID=A0A1N6WCV1_9GAMM|nr:DUF4347 domain-containing protein [Marinobacterium stanieri]SIQ87862.1 Cadherin-like [Marinobacterium stanieri]